MKKIASILLLFAITFAFASPVLAEKAPSTWEDYYGTFTVVPTYTGDGLLEQQSMQGFFYWCEKLREEGILLPPEHTFGVGEIQLTLDEHGGALSYTLKEDTHQSVYNFFDYMPLTYTYSFSYVENSSPSKGQNVVLQEINSTPIDFELSASIILVEKDGNLLLDYSIRMPKYPYEVPETIFINTANTVNQESWILKKIVTPQIKEYSSDLLGRALSNRDEYDLALSGFIKLDLCEGVNTIALEDIKKQTIAIVARNKSNDVRRVMRENTIEGMKVTVHNGRLISADIVGRVQTDGGRLDRYSTTVYF